MGINNKKKFKSNKTYITYCVIYIIGVSLISWVLIRLINSTEQELIVRYSKQELIGGAKQRSAQALQSLLVNKLGKSGLVAIPIIGLFFLIYEMLKEFAEYLRFIKKSKLFKQGLVNNLDDDFPRQNVFKFLYRKIVKEKSYKKANKEKIEEMKNSKLYKRMYKE